MTSKKMGRKVLSLSYCNTTTDCVSEGQNLQDCDTVINYDIHWNPVRIIQRFGRIDRIGSQNIKIQMINYWPTKDMEVYLRLCNRVESRMALADATASGDDDPLNEWTYEQAQMELNFCDKQLEQLREEVIDLNDLSDGVVMSDFTLDYFFTQLLKYLEKNRAKLEATPKGAYAVTEYKANPTEKGVIFFLHLKNPSENKQEKTPALSTHTIRFIFATIAIFDTDMRTPNRCWICLRLRQGDFELVTWLVIV